MVWQAVNICIEIEKSFGVFLNLYWILSARIDLFYNAIICKVLDQRHNQEKKC